MVRWSPSTGNAAGKIECHGTSIPSSTASGEKRMEALHSTMIEAGSVQLAQRACRAYRRKVSSYQADHGACLFRASSKSGSTSDRWHKGVRMNDALNLKEKILKGPVNPGNPKRSLLKKPAEREYNHNMGSSSRGYETESLPFAASTEQRIGGAGVRGCTKYRLGGSCKSSCKARSQKLIFLPSNTLNKQKTEGKIYMLGPVLANVSGSALSFLYGNRDVGLQIGLF